MQSAYAKTHAFILAKYGVDLDNEPADYRLSNGNSKLKASGIWSFNLIPIVHCPMAGACKAYCYATVGQQAFRNAVLKRARAFKATQADDFVARMSEEVQKAQAKGAKAIRVHDSGDFYSPEYMVQWFMIAALNPTMRFYAYTKMIWLVRRSYKVGAVPPNFRLIQSLGGIADDQQDASLPHARIFASHAELLAAGYDDASETDDAAAFGAGTKIGLYIHGARKARFTVEPYPPEVIDVAPAVIANMKRRLGGK